MEIQFHRVGCRGGPLNSKNTPLVLSSYHGSSERVPGKALLLVALELKDFFKAGTSKNMIRWENVIILIFFCLLVISSSDCSIFDT